MATTTKKRAPRAAKARAKTPRIPKAGRLEKPSTNEEVEYLREITEDAALLAVEPEPFTGLDFGVVAAADKARHVDGIIVALRPKWGGVHPRIVSHTGPVMIEFIARAKEAELKRYNVEKGERKPPVLSFSELTPEGQRRVQVKVVLEALRGDGRGKLRWGEGEDCELDLAGASTSQVRAAFKAAFEVLDLELSAWILKDLMDAGNVLEGLRDNGIVEAGKKGLACGLVPLLDRVGSDAAKLIEQLGAAEAAIRALGQAKPATKARTSKPRKPRTK